MCDCIATANERLKEFNTRIEVPFWTSSGRMTPFVTTCKIDDKKRGKPKLMFASCCPFCGDRYAEPERRSPELTSPNRSSPSGE